VFGGAMLERRRMPTLTATFSDRPSADRAVNDLLAAGISADNISVLMSHTSQATYLPPTEDNLDTSIAKGAVIGGGLGAIAGGLLLGGVLTVLTGGVAAPLLIAGPLAAALAGGVSGAAVGTLAGGLIGAGVSEPVAHDIEQKVADGSVLVAVTVTGDAGPDIDAIFRKDAGIINPA
jgi:hypothetical protein